MKPLQLGLEAIKKARNELAEKINYLGITEFTDSLDVKIKTYEKVLEQLPTIYSDEAICQGYAKYLERIDNNKRYAINKLKEIDFTNPYAFFEFIKQIFVDSLLQTAHGCLSHSWEKLPQQQHTALIKELNDVFIGFCSFDIDGNIKLGGSLSQLDDFSFADLTKLIILIDQKARSAEIKCIKEDFNKDELINTINERVPETLLEEFGYTKKPLLTSSWSFRKLGNALEMHEEIADQENRLMRTTQLQASTQTTPKRIAYADISQAIAKKYNESLPQDQQHFDAIETLIPIRCRESNRIFQDIETQIHEATSQIDNYKTAQVYVLMDGQAHFNEASRACTLANSTQSIIQTLGQGLLQGAVDNPESSFLQENVNTIKQLMNVQSTMDHIAALKVEIETRHQTITEMVLSLVQNQKLNENDIKIVDQALQRNRLAVQKLKTRLTLLENSSQQLKQIDGKVRLHLSYGAVYKNALLKKHELNQVAHVALESQQTLYEILDQIKLSYQRAKRSLQEQRANLEEPSANFEIAQIKNDTQALLNQIDTQYIGHLQTLLCHFVVAVINRNQNWQWRDKRAIEAMRQTINQYSDWRTDTHQQKQLLNALIVFSKNSSATAGKLAMFINWLKEIELTTISYETITVFACSDLAPNAIFLQQQAQAESDLPTPPVMEEVFEELSSIMTIEDSVPQKKTPDKLNESFYQQHKTSIWLGAGSGAMLAASVIGSIILAPFTFGISLSLPLGYTIALSVGVTTAGAGLGGVIGACVAAIKDCCFGLRKNKQPSMRDADFDEGIPLIPASNAFGAVHDRATPTQARHHVPTNGNRYLDKFKEKSDMSADIPSNYGTNPALLVNSTPSTIVQDEPTLTPSLGVSR